MRWRSSGLIAIGSSGLGARAADLPPTGEFFGFDVFGCVRLERGSDLSMICPRDSRRSEAAPSDANVLVRLNCRLGPERPSSRRSPHPPDVAAVHLATSDPTSFAFRVVKLLLVYPHKSRVVPYGVVAPSTDVSLVEPSIRFYPTSILRPGGGRLAWPANARSTSGKRSRRAAAKLYRATQRSRARAPRVAACSGCSRSSAMPRDSSAESPGATRRPQPSRIS